MNYWWILLCMLCFEGVSRHTHTHPWEKDKKSVKFPTTHFEEKQDKNVFQSVTHVFSWWHSKLCDIYQNHIFSFQIILPLVACFFPHCPVSGRYPELTNLLVHVSLVLPCLLPWSKHNVTFDHLVKMSWIFCRVFLVKTDPHTPKNTPKRNLLTSIEISVKF